MPSLIDRIKLALLITPAIFLMNLWVLFVSNTPFIDSLGMTRVVFTSLAVAIMAAYFIVLFAFTFIRVSREQ